MFVMANAVLAGITIRSASSASVEYAKSSLGGTVYLQADITQLRENMQQREESGEIDRGARVGFTRPGVTADVANDIADSDYVKDYTYGIESSANADGFELVENDETKMRAEFEQMRGQGNFGPNGGAGGGSETDSDSAESDSAEATQSFSFGGDTAINGINSYAFIDGVKNGTMTIADGEYFDETTDDSVMISEDLRILNSLKVGDTIKLKKSDDSGTVSLKIIGVYDTTDDNSLSNTLYMNVATAAKFLSTESYNDGKYNVDNVQYFLTNAEYADTFIDEAKAKHPELAENNLTLSTDTSAYEQMVGPIESVGSFATTILLIVIIASILIIALMVTINIKDRRYEMGVLLSLGAKKLNIIGQVLVELVFVATLAFVLSIGTSSFLAQAVGSTLLDTQIANSTQQSEQNFGRPGTAPGGGGPDGGVTSGGGFGGGMQSFTAGNSNSNAEAIDSIDISASPADYAILFALGYGVLIIALILPTINIIRFEPKTILTGKE
jgi:putative ABC transport system permease protein